MSGNRFESHNEEKTSLIPFGAAEANGRMLALLQLLQSLILQPRLNNKEGLLILCVNLIK